MYIKIKFSWLIVLLTILSLPVVAVPKKSEANYCLNLTDQKEFENLLIKNATDKNIVRLVAIRQGLCEMIDKNLISLETGIDIWKNERKKMIAVQTKKQLKGLSIKLSEQSLFFRK